MSNEKRHSDYFEPYSKIVGDQVIDQLHLLAAPLKGLKILHINSTRLGGGVAEILQKMIPMINALNIEAKWEVIEGSPEFYQCTKTFHNAIQGIRMAIPATCYDIIKETGRLNAEKLRKSIENADIVIIHDPQPLALIENFPQRKSKWIWRCHIDASRPDKYLWDQLKKYISQYNASIFSLDNFTQPLPHPMFIMPPSIDPLSEKNMELDSTEINQVYASFGIDPKRPLLLQVSRYDRFKDPLGVIEAYRMVKKYNPEVQLVLAGGAASDDPEGTAIYNEVANFAGEDPDIHHLLLPENAHRTINALQRAADVVLQKSTKEGFGLTVTEALWKKKPVIGGNTGGIRLQVINWQTGFLVNTPEGAAYHIRYLLQNPNKIHDMGSRGKEYVREKFLITRNLRDYLTLFISLLFPGQDRIELK